MKSSVFRVGQIGSGGRGGTLGQLAHQPENGFRVSACCDTTSTVLAQCKKRYGGTIHTTRDWRELLEQPLDGVIIATPDFLHEEQAVAALEKGLAVYLEKPMAITTAGCDRILAAAAKSRARLYLGHNMRHMPFVKKMKALIDDGAIGEIKACWCRHFVGHGGDFYFHDWHAERRFSTSLLLQKAAHDLDIIHWLCGGHSRLINALGGLTLYGDLPGRKPATRRPRHIGKVGDYTLFPPIRARELNHRIDVEDLSTMQMRLSNGVFATYAQCHYTPDYWRNYTVIGTEGRLENFGNGEPGTCIRLWNKRANYHPKGDRTYKIPVTRGTHSGSDPLIINEFLRYARDGGPTATSPLDARESVAAGCAATESLRHGGKPVKVRPAAAAIRRCFETR